MESFDTKGETVVETMTDSINLMSKGEDFKDRGNAFFKVNKFSDAIDMYTEATKLGLTGK
jgi:hypothetical protein